MSSNNSNTEKLSGPQLKIITLVSAVGVGVFMSSMDASIVVVLLEQFQQFGFLLQEVIQDWIERGEVLEWVDFLGRINHLINSLDHLAEKYDDKPFIHQILLKTKSYM